MAYIINGLPKSSKKETDDTIWGLHNITIKPENWANKTYTITCDRINTESVINIFYNNASKDTVELMEVAYIQGNHTLTITCGILPTNDVVIDAITILNI